MMVVAIRRAKDPATGETQLTRSPYVVLDLETGDASEKDIQAAIERWTPPGNVTKKETKEKKKAEAAIDIREDAALLNASPILCIAVRTKAQSLIFNGMDRVRHKVKGFRVLSLGDQVSMLKAFQGWLDRVADRQTSLVGWNLWGFDIPKLNHRYLDLRLRKPKILVRARSTEEFEKPVDLMRDYAAYYSIEVRDKQFIKLDKAIDELQLEEHASPIDGSYVPGLFREGHFQAILDHGARDVNATWDIWRRMTNAAYGEERGGANG